MKRLINPPIQNLLWLGGMVCVGLAAWSIWELRQAEEQQFATTAGVSVDIPDASELSIPGVRQYRRLVEAPLFWEERARPVIAPPPPRPVVAPVKKAEVVEVEMMLPVGRLVGIVDLGKKKYALVRSDTENKSLYKGDVWEGWTVQDINSERVVITAGKQKAEVPLIADFEAPAANKQMLAARKRQEQRKRNRQQQQRLRQAQQKQQAQHYNRAGGQNVAAQGQGQRNKNAAPPSPVNPVRNQNRVAGRPAQPAEPAPVLSIKEALEARQRLMASRWGKDKKK